MIEALIVLGAYLVGSIPVGIVIAGITGKDPRKSGSGNIGATNVLRTAGKAAGIATLLGDAAKGFLPAGIALFIGEPPYVVALAALASFLGHLYPLYLRFKGGKGVATALGIYLALSPLAVAIAAVIFFASLFRWRYVSVSSLAGTGLMPLVLYGLAAPEVYVYLALVIGLFVYVKHRDNIERLRAGKENRFRL